MKVTQMPPVHAANLVANSGNTAYGLDVITMFHCFLWFGQIKWIIGSLELQTLLEHGTNNISSWFKFSAPHLHLWIWEYILTLQNNNMFGFWW